MPGYPGVRPQSQVCCVESCGSATLGGWGAPLWSCWRWGGTGRFSCPLGKVDGGDVGRRTDESCLAKLVSDVRTVGYRRRGSGATALGGRGKRQGREQADELVFWQRLALLRLSCVSVYFRLHHEACHTPHVTHPMLFAHSFCWLCHPFSRAAASLSCSSSLLVSTCSPPLRYLYRSRLT